MSQYILIPGILIILISTIFMLSIMSLSCLLDWDFLKTDDWLKKAFKLLSVGVLISAVGALFLIGEVMLLGVC